MENSTEHDPQQDRRLRANHGSVLPPDIDVDSIWWPELKAWIDAELLGMNALST
jgi:hypothetical protein